MNTTWHDIQDPELLAQAAISAATKANWQEAEKINLKILKSLKEDIESLNRLARAQICQGKFAQAKKVYEKVLSLDPYNIIAKKNFERIAKAGAKEINGKTLQVAGSQNLISLFLSEPGKTKLINLLNLAQPSILATLICGEEVHINPKNHSVTIITSDGTYLGALPDDLAHRLIAFISGGNKYQAFVKSASAKTLTIFIKEVFRSVKFTNQPSFNTSLSAFKEMDYSY